MQPSVRYPHALRHVQHRCALPEVARAPLAGTGRRRVLESFALALLAAGACHDADVPSPRNVSTEVAPAASASPSPAQAVPSASSPPIVTDVALASATPSSVAPASSVSPAGPAADKAYDQTTTAITATVGDHSFVVVPGNATTSFTWRADPKPDESVLSVADPKYTPQPPTGCDAGCVGYGGPMRSA